LNPRSAEKHDLYNALKRQTARSSRPKQFEVATIAKPTDTPPMDDTIDHLRLIRTESVGPLTYRRMIARFSSAAAAIAALPELSRAGGRATALKTPSRAEVERELAALHRKGATLLILGQPDYPKFLADTPDAPSALAILGDVQLLNSRCIGIVGARNASANGMRIAQTLAAELAPHLTVVSGLARGIDAAAHAGALTTGKTIAVIAGGLDIAYPPENEQLQRQIAEFGAVIAESPLGTAPMAKHFPKRNRIIAGLVLGLIVIEAAPRSGRPGLPARPTRPGFQRPDPPGRPSHRNRRRRPCQPSRPPLAARLGARPALPPRPQRLRGTPRRHP
jgi:DNA protecting protein DprA